ncbi:hypothetical protein [Leeia aquatica]|uniref:Uncharacterized protein n=1 Tax=Leeia aquatica TaxID=2725557 RepID=A0A847SGV3_9NEIS|nr:hypothetical protein [Leeia aquatica]NLR76429.1 hypothetical protein [Leeia aquatica]
MQDTAFEPGSPKASVAHRVGLGLLGFLALPVLLGIALWLKQGLPSVLLSLGGWIALFACVYATHKRTVLKGMLVALLCAAALFAAGMVELWLWSIA